MDSLRLKRSERNPILEPINDKLHWWEAKCVFNPGVAIFNNKIYLLYRALGEVHYSTFGLAQLSDPEKVESRLSTPIYEADENNPYEEFGVEDARITKIDNTYYIVYNGPSVYHDPDKKLNPWDHMKVPWRLRSSMASTTDFKTFKRHGVILPEIDTKDGVLFPEKINGQYVMLHRIFPDMYISYSDKIDHFYRGEVLCIPRPSMWDSERIGAGSVPIKTRLGWLLFYHGVKKYTDGSFKYSLGIILLDLYDPKRILYRSSDPVLTPEKTYEKIGYVNNVVFTCGAIEWEERYWVYYGAADQTIGVAYIDKNQLIDYLLNKIKK